MRWRRPRIIRESPARSRSTPSTTRGSPPSWCASIPRAARPPSRSSPPSRRSKPSRVHEFLQQLINGLHLGATYALIALGYSMVYGVLRLINFAHGDVFMLGAYAGLFTVTGMQLANRPGW